MKLSLHVPVLSVLLLVAVLGGTFFSSVSAQGTAADLTCPDDGVSLQKADFNLISGDACILCVDTPDACGVECSCPTTECLTYSCQLTPDGCGTVICAGEGVAITDPPTAAPTTASPITAAPTPSPTRFLANCKSITSCTDCLSSSNCGRWSAGVCMPECLILDAECYKLNPNEEETVNEICQRAENDRADGTLCASRTDCTSCVESILSDGSSTCQWYDEAGYCGADCGMDGCGATVCEEAMPEQPEEVVPPEKEECPVCAADDGTCVDVGESWLLVSDNCSRCTCDSADGDVSCVGCPITAVPPEEEECPVCAADDGTCVDVGESWLLVSDNCSRCTCDSADGDVSCVGCPITAVPPEEEIGKELQNTNLEQVGTDCAGINVTVACVLREDETIPCEEYAPTSSEDCVPQIKYTYFVRQEAPPTDVILTSIVRTREGSPTGDTRDFATNRWGENLTPTSMGYYEMNSWESEGHNFCLRMVPPPTVFEVVTSACTTTFTYNLIAAPFDAAIEALPSLQSAEEVESAIGETTDTLETGVDDENGTEDADEDEPFLEEDPMMEDDTSSASGASIAIRFFSVMTLSEMVMLW